MSIETFNTIVLVWIGIAVVLFPVLLKIPAPYGRHTRHNWGPMINNRLGWFLMELPSLLVFGWLALKNRPNVPDVISVFALLWIIHYSYRAIVFPFLIKTKGKKMPVVIMLFAVFFNLINGGLNGYWFGVLSPSYPSDWVTDFRFIGGLLLFITGFAIHRYHDNLLIQLRKNSSGGYQIPSGGLFRYISCPNFLGEMIEWGGFALMTWCLPASSFFIWTIVNLLPRALDHHRWYLSSFENYPKNRKALIPFIL